MIPPRLVNRVLYPLHERLKRKRTHARLAELERSQWLSPREIRDLTLERLVAHLELAYHETPYFKRLFDEHGISPRRITSLADLAKIPYLTKQIVQERSAELAAPRWARDARKMSTGGSTGIPVTVLVDRERAAFTDAARLRAHRWWDVEMGAPEIVLWGSPLELGRQDLVRELRDRFLNSRLLSAFDLSEPALARYAKALARTKPDKLYGYASALYVFASYLRRTGWIAGEGWPRVVFTTAEPLYDFQRALIESTFGCRAAVEYGCREGGLIANECPKGGLHIPAEGMVVEIAADNEIVITNLESRAMPMIRYRTGDVGELSSEACPCGRGLPTLARVDGRRTDFLVTPRGKLIHALAAIYILREAQGVREFRVNQTAVDRLVVTIVPDRTFTSATSTRIAERMRRLFDDEASVEIAVTPAIPPIASGKHRYVISEVADSMLATLGGEAR